MAGAITVLPPIKRGATSVILRIKIYDTASTVGHAGLTGLSSTSSGLLITSIRSSNAAGSANTYSAGSSTVEGITTLGTYATPTAGKCRFAEISATNFKGWYELQFADAVFATGNYLIVTITSSVSGHAQCDFIVPLTDFDPYDSVRGGLTALPNASPSTPGGLEIQAALASTIFQTLTSDGAFGISSSIGKALKDFLASPDVNITKLNGSTTAADALKVIHDAVETGTCQSGSTSTTIKLATGANSNNDFYKNAAVVATSNTGAKQVRQITGYVGSTRVATVDSAWVTTPDSSTTYAIIGRLV